MHKHVHTHTNMYTDNRNTTKNIHHIIAVHDHSPRYPYSSSCIQIHNDIMHCDHSPRSYYTVHCILLLQVRNIMHCDHSPRSYYTHVHCIRYYYRNFNTIIHNTTQFDEYSFYRAYAGTGQSRHLAYLWSRSYVRIAHAQCQTFIIITQYIMPAHAMHCMYTCS